MILVYNLSLTACSFHLKVKNSKSKEKIFPLNRTIAVTREEGEPLSFRNAKELFYLFFHSHGDMIDDEAKKMTFSCDMDAFLVLESAEYSIMRMKINSGVYGSSSEIIDGKTKKRKLKKEASDIELRPFYLYVVFPRDSSEVTVNKGMFLFQNEGIYGIKTITTEYMQKFFSENFGITLSCRTISPDLFMRKIVTMESIKKLILIKNLNSFDAADNGHFGYGKEVRTIANLTFGAASWEAFQRKLFHFMGNRFNLFEFEQQEYDTLKLNVSIGGRERTIDLHNLENLSIIEGIPNEIQLADGHPDLEKLDEHMSKVAGEYLSEMVLEIR